MAPVVIAVLGAAVVGAVGSLKQASAQSDAYLAESQASQYNAQIALQNAAIERSTAAEEERRGRIESSKVLGQMRAAYGASGISSATGSPLDVLAESASNAELNALTTRYQGELKAKAKEQEANLAYRRSQSMVSNAESAKEAGYYSAVSSLLSGGASAYTTSVKLNRTS